MVEIVARVSLTMFFGFITLVGLLIAKQIIGSCWDDLRIRELGWRGAIARDWFGCAVVVFGTCGVVYLAGDMVMTWQRSGSVPGE